MKKTLTIACSLFALSLTAQIPTNGLVAYYPFNGNANDASVNGHNGTVNGVTLTADRFGNANSAYSFNIGSAIQTMIPASVAPAASNMYSFSFWFNRNNSTQVNILLQYKDGTPNGGNVSNYDIFNYHPSCNSGTIAVQNYPFNSPGACSPGIINIGVWTHIYVVFDQISHSFQVYKDAQYWFSGATGNVSPSTGTLTIGNNSNRTFSFQGKMDDVGIWNRALTIQEIQQLYNSNGVFSIPTLSQWGLILFGGLMLVVVAVNIKSLS